MFSMDFLWDEIKNEWLQSERYVSFEEIAAMIQQHDIVDVIENPSRQGQYCFILRIRSYIWVVPFVIDADDRIVLKTAYLSRKFHRHYGGEQQR